MQIRDSQPSKVGITPTMESSILFVEPGFVRGMARTFDLWGDLDDYNFSPSPEDADRLALASDFAAVNRDLEEAIESYGKEQSSTAP